jgi:hypothetical protein
MADNKATKKNNIEIPQKLLDLIKAEDTALEITRICFENEIKDDAKIRGISYQTGRVLVGDLPPEDFEKDLAEKVKISSFLASKIAREISESIFYPVKGSLAALYGTELVSLEIASSSEAEEKAGMLEETNAYRESVEKKLESTKENDTYREPIE